MTQIAAAPQRRNLALWSLVLLGVGLLSLLPLSLLNPGLDSGSTASAGLFDRTRIAYFEFGVHADTLWLADPQAPTKRTKLFSVPHAPEYGVIPSLSPDRRSVAYTALAPETAAPGPDSPADLWVASLAGGRPRLIAAGVDLLVPPVWTADGAQLIYRRSSGETQQLLVASLQGSPRERQLRASTASLFPVAVFADRFYYVEVDASGSTLHEAGLNGEDRTVATLATGLTRDWTLAPDGRRLAYLEMNLAGEEVSARAFVLDVASGTRVPAGAPDSNAFSPTWDVQGRLVVGQLRAGATSTAATVVSGDAAATLPAPPRGFDVPLGASKAGVALTSFDGNSLVNPGRATLVVVEPSGARREIASGEVTYLGWITP